MSAFPSLVLLDADPKSRDAIAYGFQRSDWTIHATGEPREATAFADTQRPELMVVSTGPGAAGVNAMRFVSQLRATDVGHTMPVLVIGDAAMREGVMAAGASEYIERPTFIRDIVTMGRLTVDAHAQDGECEGELADLGLYFITRALASARRSAVLFLERERRSGDVRFADGELMSARVGQTVGANAFLHLLLWESAHYHLRLGDPGTARKINKPIERLLEDGQRFVSEFEAVAERVGGTHVVYRQDERRIADVSRQIPNEVLPLVHSYDGKRTLIDVVEDSPFKPLDTIMITYRLAELKAIVRVDAGAARPDRGAARLTEKEPLLDGSSDDEVAAAPPRTGATPPPITVAPASIRSLAAAVTTQLDLEDRRIADGAALDAARVVDAAEEAAAEADRSARARLAAEERAAEERHAAEVLRLAEERRAIEEKRAAEVLRIAEERRAYEAAEERRAAEQRQREEARRAAEQRQRDEEHAQQERVARARAEAERIAAEEARVERATAEKLAAEHAELIRHVAEREAADRVAKAKAAAQQIAAVELEEERAAARRAADAQAARASAQRAGVVAQMGPDGEELTLPMPRLPGVALPPPSTPSSPAASASSSVASSSAASSSAASSSSAATAAVPSAASASTSPSASPSRSPARADSTARPPAPLAARPAAPAVEARPASPASARGEPPRAPAASKNAPASPPAPSASRAPDPRMVDSGRHPKVDFDSLDEEFFAREADLFRVPEAETFEDLAEPVATVEPKRKGWFSFGGTSKLAPTPPRSSASARPGATARPGGAKPAGAASSSGKPPVAAAQAKPTAKKK